MNLNPFEFDKAPENSLFIKKGGKLIATSVQELIRPFLPAKKDNGELAFNYDLLNKNITKLQNNELKCFIIAFTLFELKALKGEIDVEEDLLLLDEKVLTKEMSIKEAVNKHEFLKLVFEALEKENK